MNESQTTVVAIREVLFRNANTVNDQLVERFGIAAEHLDRQEDRAVIGALEGAEADIAKMRSLMLLARDCFVLPPAKGGPH